MSEWQVVVADVAGRGPLRWFAVPRGERIELREAAAALEATDAEPDVAVAREAHRLLPPAPGGAPPVRFVLEAREEGLVGHVPGAGLAPVVDVDLGGELDARGRAILPGRLIALRPRAGHRLIALEGAAEGDLAALARGLARGAHELDALSDRALLAALDAAPRPGDPSPWRALDLALRARRDARAPFLAAIEEAAAARVRAAWEGSVARILARHGLPPSPRRPLGDAARDWFVAIRAGIERLRSFAPLARNDFAVEVALSLEALGEEPAFARLVPLARREGRDTFSLTLSRKGDPSYRIFDVVRTEQGGAVVSGRRVQTARPHERLRKMTCSCGGRIHEGDARCRGCGTALSDLGQVRLSNTFMVGTTVEVCAVCECGAGIGAEDCGRSLEE